MAWKRQLTLGPPLTFPDLQSPGTDLILPGHLRPALSRLELAHGSDFEFTGILLPGHLHCSPPFNVSCPLTPCLTFGVQSSLPSPHFGLLGGHIQPPC